MRILFLLISLSADVDAPATSEPHALIRCQARTEGKGCAWWVMGPAGFVDVQPYREGNRGIVWTGPPGRYTVLLVVTTADGALDQGQAIVTIKGAEPGPGPPTPGPAPAPPSPTPTFPDGRYRLAAFAHRTATETARPREQRLALGASFERLALDISNGKFAAVPAAQQEEAILQAARIENSTTLGAAVSDWESWLAALARELKRFADAGELANPMDYQAAWREIAVGLKGGVQ